MYFFGDIIIQVCTRFFSNAVILILDHALLLFKDFILGLQENWEGAENFYTLSPSLHHIHNLPHYQHPLPTWYISYNPSTYTDTF